MKSVLKLPIARLILFRQLCLALIFLGAFLALQSVPAATNVVAAVAPGTLAYQLATNAAVRAAHLPGGREKQVENQVEIYAPFSVRADRFFEPAWSHEFWLKGVSGLSATCIGYSNINNGQGLCTMVSPRHYLCATHMHPEGKLIAFLDGNNELHWRKTLQRLDVGIDTSVGLLDADLPPGVGFLPVLPENFTNYLPTVPGCYVQGIGMNQDMRLFGQPTTFAMSQFVNWDCQQTVPNGLGTNWNVRIRGGDSSNPALLLVGNQLVLISHNYFSSGGPSYARQLDAINHTMHQLSTNNFLPTDYQLTPFPLTNWPALR